VVIRRYNFLHVEINEKELVNIMKESISIIGGCQKEKFAIKNTDRTGLKPEIAGMKSGKLGRRGKGKRCNLILRIFW